MKAITTTILIIITIAASIVAFGQNKMNQDPYPDNEIILKIKPAFKNQCKNNALQIESVNTLLNAFDVSEINVKFPFSKVPEKNDGRQTDITTIYSVKFSNTIPVLELAYNLSVLPEVEYAQPAYRPQLMYTTNDPLTPAQYYLNNLKAYQAWDICQGSANVIIGITDTGVEYAHEDLVDNIAYNYNDPINGIDDDNDGYVDNFRGWDLGDNDNSAEWSEASEYGANDHGVRVSGYSAAKTNNGIGIASPGFNCRFLPVKISDVNGMLNASYEGIVYAADHGCQVINCSWGGISPHPYGQDIINYATFNRNALVIAAAGNYGNLNNDIFYPCAYNNVICVAASNSADVMWYKSCHGPQVDITAPGEAVYSTIGNNSYNSGWGTSFASPLAASVAALIIAQHNDTLTALQTGHILKLACDNIDTIPDNIPFAGQLGNGRINMLKAVSPINSPALEFDSIEFIPSTDNDTLYITGIIHNYLSACNNINASISCSNSHIQIIEQNQFIASMGYNSDYHFTTFPFTCKILPGMPYDEIVSFTITLSSGSYIENQT
ncbi:MAG: hypothetical protein CVU05_10670, partial [Bacteroidetes bacterium HGW-Bacteroidetes-21]